MGKQNQGEDSSALQLTEGERKALEKADRTPEKRTINLTLPLKGSEYRRIAEIGHRAGLPKSEIVRQCVLESLHKIEAAASMVARRRKEVEADMQEAVKKNIGVPPELLALARRLGVRRPNGLKVYARATLIQNADTIEAEAEKSTRSASKDLYPEEARWQQKTEE